MLLFFPSIFQRRTCRILPDLDATTVSSMSTCIAADGDAERMVIIRQALQQSKTTAKSSVVPPATAPTELELQEARECINAPAPGVLNKFFQSVEFNGPFKAAFAFYFLSIAARSTQLRQEACQELEESTVADWGVGVILNRIAGKAVVGEMQKDGGPSNSRRALVLTLLLFASPLGIQMGNLIWQAFIGRPDVAAWSRWEFTPLVLEFILCELRKGLSATRDGAPFRPDEELRRVSRTSLGTLHTFCRGLSLPGKCQW